MKAHPGGGAETIKGWDWKAFQGSAVALRLNRRDLAHLWYAMRLAGKWRCAVQAGGNLGIFPKFLAAHFQAVYTFEPSDALFPMMCHNAPEPNIRRYQAALGYRRAMVGTEQSRQYKHDKPAHEGVTHIVPSGTTPTLLIDDLNLPVCDLIYLDVEGWEWNALRGAAMTIRTHRPVIAVEVNDCIKAIGQSAEQLEAWLFNCQYAPAGSMAGDRFYIPRETVIGQD